jgi:Predicted metal-dependent membrane protease
VDDRDTSAPALPPPGWYADPWQASSVRWWDGTTWTGHATPPSPAPPVVPREPPPTFPLAGGMWAIAGITLSIVASQTLSPWLAHHVWQSPAFFIAAFYLPIYGGIAATCVLVSRRYGSGNPRADFGWQARGTDVWRGLLVWIGLAVAIGIARAPWLHDQTVERTSRMLRYDYQHLGTVAIIELAFFAAVAAPLFEELAFRGLLLRAFSQRCRVGWAVALQAVCFGAYHVNASLGWGNIPIVVGLCAGGAVFGIAAARWQRLGPGMVGHALFNAVLVVSLVAAHHN